MSLDDASSEPPEQPGQAPLTSHRAKLVLEAALLCLGRPLPLGQLSALFDDSIGLDTIRSLLDELALEYRDRGFELVCQQEGWRVQSRPDVSQRLEALHAPKVGRYSQAALQVLAVIAYRQPVTKGDIEEIRGVSVSSAMLQQFEERGWIVCIGHRDSPGHPALWVTTNQFLDDVGMLSLEELAQVQPEAAPSGEGGIVQPWVEEVELLAAQQELPLDAADPPRGDADATPEPDRSSGPPGSP